MTERPGYFVIIRGDGVALGADGALQPPTHRSRPITSTKEPNRAHNPVRSWLHPKILQRDIAKRDAQM
jgi:hypothetical protein